MIEQKPGGRFVGWNALLARWWDWALSRLVIEGWLRRCLHRPEDVTADILEADHLGLSIAYCNKCGSVQIRRVIGPAAVLCGEWRRPRPLWCEK